MTSTIQPGGTIGVLGGGQLGRMLAFAARRMGYRVHVLAPGRDNPAGQVAEMAIDAEYLPKLVETFARGVDVVTFEFENVPAEAVEAAAASAPVHPSAEVLRTTQDRGREKAFLRLGGMPAVDFDEADTAEGCRAAVEALGTPAVVKSCGFGYDGKGQAVARTADEAADAWSAVGGGQVVVERWLDLAMEVSVVAARSAAGEFVHYGVLENAHERHILDLTVTDAPLSAAQKREALEIAHAVGDGLNIVGTYCVEFFVTGDDRLLVNEIAPRPHNSGHLTIEAAATSQFEQQLRAVCGLPLGSTEWHAPAAMANLLGDLWADGVPAWDQALAVPGVTLHLYGKREPRMGRKMGHLTAVGGSREEAAERVVEARRRLAGHVVS